MEKKRYTLAVMVDNKAGVLSQVSRLFSRKGYNIESLAVGAIEDPEVSRITIEILAENDQQVNLYYQINYLCKPVPENAAYFHAQFRREHPTAYMQDFTMLANIQGRGQYVGTYMIWQSNSSGWWGEGEVKVFVDGDTDYPSICYTGTEDYFCGSYNFENQQTHQYEAFTTPYAGLPQIIRPDGLYRSQTRFGLYRWHLTDPIVFQKDIRLTIQALAIMQTD